MASCKTLFELATTSAAKLVHKTLKKIEEQSPSTVSYVVSSEKYRVTAQIVQNHLRQHIAPAAVIWDTLFHSVFDIQDHVLDDRLLYATFIHPKVNIYRFKMPELRLHHIDYYGEIDYKRDVDAIRESIYKNRVAFWMEHVPMLSRIVELDVTDVECDRVIEAFVRTCNAVEVIGLPNELSEELLKTVTQSLPDLRKITYSRNHCGSYEKVELALSNLKHLEHLDQRVDGSWLLKMKLQHRLKLKQLKLNCSEVDELLDVLNICPDLTELDLKVVPMNYTPDAFDRVYQSLALSTPNISKLNLNEVKMSSDAADHFFPIKGTKITDLSLHLTNGKTLFTISKYCPNMTSLCINDIEHSFTPFEKATFPKLKHLSVNDGCKKALVVADYCLANSVNVDSLELNFLSDPGCYASPSEMQDGLKRFFCTNKQMKLLKSLKLLLYEDECSFRMTENVHECCPQLTHLEIGPLTNEARRYLENVLGNKNVCFKVVGN